MPVLSYLAYPAQGRKSDLISTLGAMPECEVIESENDDLLILVTSAATDDDERTLEKRLDAIDSLSMLTLVFGHRSADMSPHETTGLSPERPIPTGAGHSPARRRRSRRAGYVSAPEENA